MSDSDQNAEDFRRFVSESENRLRQALSAAVGSQHGRDATFEVLSYAWENWERLAAMENPVGYLFVVGRDRARKALRIRQPVFHAVDESHVPWIEPGLPLALERLPDRQREVVVLLHCYQWTFSEVAEILDISKSTVQNHSERALRALRMSMGVEV